MALSTGSNFVQKVRILMPPLVIGTGIPLAEGRRRNAGCTVNAVTRRVRQCHWVTDKKAPEVWLLFL